MMLPKNEERKLTMEEQTDINVNKMIEAMFNTKDSTKTISDHEREILEKSESLDARLKTCIQEELEGFSTGLQLLEKSQENSTEIDRLANEISGICQACDDLFQNYTLVKEITTIRRNLKEVIDTVRYLKTLKDKVKEIEEALKDENNLLRVHSIVRTYEMLRLAIEKQIRKRSLLYGPDVEPYFQQITQIRQFLMQTIEDIFTRFVEHANKTPEILVKVAVITERDRRDREQIKQQAKGEGVKVQEFELQGENYVENIKNYVKTAAEQSIKEKFELTDKPWVNTVPTMKSLQQLLDEITIASFDAAPCFPPDYSLRDVYLIETTEKLKENFEKWCQADPSKLGNDLISNTTIISLLKWINDDFVPTMDRIGADHKNLPDLLVATRGGQLQYKERIKGKMFDWVENIAKSDYKQTPMTINNLLYTTAPVDLFGIVKEQIDIAKTSKSSDFIFEVVNALVPPLEMYSNNVINQLRLSMEKKKENEKKKDKSDSEDDKEKEDDDELPLGYVISLINNSNACIDKTETMVEDVGEIVGHELASRFDFSTVTSSFERVIDEACSYLVGIVVSDCQVKIDDLFNDEYYDGDDCVEMIAGCIQEYASGDFAPNLLSIYVEDLVTKILNEVINRYILQLCTKKHKFYNNEKRKTGERVEKDKSTFGEFLKQFIDEKKLEKILNVLRGFSELLKNERDGVFSGYKTILQDYKDCPVEVPKYIVGQREDFSGSDKDEAYKTLESQAADVMLDPKMKPTIFRNISLPTKFGF
ncbi:exocyst complex component, putative [Entamoeba invadens IP1]|uniref:Exocyst complex component, putative n=1 Tax=Entamoeba invadens IP1 TaxID=370355 RepID=A0A0A1U094_ENTIV|nr:exocyst complex component, putative [Entamoeba invadens IP1]ELP87310.1 exocyst complex component, putative [Entamoeba invadens IP1]|eukprot:XP_004254081.1 exocyst complex component, putative [Entamoeba invadens IP1]